MSKEKVTESKLIITATSEGNIALKFDPPIMSDEDFDKAEPVKQHMQNVVATLGQIVIDEVRRRNADERELH